jgi:diguanylate cyclase (GGDEF)-like protein
VDESAIIYKQKDCVGCNRCSRVCPIKEANTAYLAADGKFKVRINNEKCIHCGNCVKECPHGARLFQDDTESFFDDLRKGADISVVVPPAFRLNFPDTWKDVLKWLRLCGVKRIFNGNVGWDIYMWVYMKKMAENKLANVIMPVCPCVYSYCEIHLPKLVRRLSPAKDPFVCSAVYIHKYLGIKTKIAALTPCAAHSAEFWRENIVGYNVTFVKLREYIMRYEVDLSNVKEPHGIFDNEETVAGYLAPISGGPSRCVETFLPGAVVDQADGREIYDILREYNNIWGTASAEGYTPDAICLFNCRGGCVNGPGGIPNLSRSKLMRAISETRKMNALAGVPEMYKAIFQDFDNSLHMEDFIRAYKPVESKSRYINESEVQRVFASMSKDTYYKQNINCQACGLSSCREMAKQIVLGLNTRNNCIYYLRDTALAEYEKNSEYIGLVRNLGETLASAVESSFQDIIAHSLGLLAEAFKGDTVSIWRISDKKTETGSIQRVTRQFSHKKSPHALLSASDLFPREWIQTLSRGEVVFYNQEDEMGGDFYTENQLFLDKFVFFCALPVSIQGKFLGFLSIAGRNNSRFSQNEITALYSCAILIFSSIVGRQLEKNAYTDALTGAYNRRYFMEVAAGVFEKASRQGGLFCVAIFDLDFFKKVNDTYGHAAGDLVLASVAGAVKNQIRSYDTFARYGGEEFVMIMAEQTEERAMAFSERLREVIEALNPVYNGEIIHITASIGVASNKGCANVDEALINADAALYIAKSSGRNQVRLFVGDEQEALT